MIVSLIVAMSENRVIGRAGGLPWRLSDDLRRFKRLTTGHTIIMGRRTFASIGRPLPDRTSIVITRQADWQANGTIVVHSLDEALGHAGDADEAFIIGGGEIFKQALPRADRLYLTIVHAELRGDVSFPEIDESAWQCIHEEHHESNERNEYAYTFRDLARVMPKRD